MSELIHWDQVRRRDPLRVGYVGDSAGGWSAGGWSAGGGYVWCDSAGGGTVRGGSVGGGSVGTGYVGRGDTRDGSEHQLVGPGRRSGMIPPLPPMLARPHDSLRLE